MAQGAATNITDADHIARIDALTSAGRVNWFSLMAYLVFVFITLLGVEDADFFIPSRQTQLPLINISIPTEAFFYFAPILGVALYVYLHLYVRKATGALAAAPAKVKGTPLERHLKPWLLNDLVLRWRGDGAIEEKPLDGLSAATVIALVWVAGPFVLFGMWVRTWPAHNEAMTTLAGLCFMLSVYAGHISWVRLRRDLRGDPAQVTASDIPRDLALLFAAMLVFNLGWIKTESGRPWNRFGEQTATMSGNITVLLASIGNLRDPTWWGALTPARLAEVQFSALPPDQADPTVARHRYRAEWCGRAGLDPQVCGTLPTPGSTSDALLWERRATWCQRNRVSDCPAYFNGRDEEFRTEWTEFRQRLIAALPKPDLRRADLRGADLSNASLTGVILREARLNGALFLGAELQGANLHSAQMQGANLSDAQMQGADLRFAQMQRAFLSEARLRGAKFFDTNLQGAHISGAHLEGADLSGENMQDAILRYAKLAGADLRRARMQGASLIHAQMQAADLREVHLEGADLFRAQMARTDLGAAHLQGADLRQAQMQGANLSNAQMQAADLKEAQMKGANLSDSQLQGVVLFGARMVETNWAGATGNANPAQYADLRGARALDQTRLSSLIGNAATLLPETPDGAPDLFVPSCWATDPPGFDHLVAGQARNGLSADDLRASALGYFCAPGEAPRKTGTPWPVDADPPWGAQNAGEFDRDYRQRMQDWAAAQPPGDPID